MGDDLSQFFAKKAAKTKDKKKKVKVNLDEVGEVLEREAKRQVILKYLLQTKFSFWIYIAFLSIVFYLDSGILIFFL